MNIGSMVVVGLYVFSEFVTRNMASAFSKLGLAYLYQLSPLRVDS